MHKSLRNSFALVLFVRVVLNFPSQGGLGLSKESLALLLKRLSDGKTYRVKVGQIDEADRNIEAVQQVKSELHCNQPRFFVAAGMIPINQPVISHFYCSKLQAKSHRL